MAGRDTTRLARSTRRMSSSASLPPEWEEVIVASSVEEFDDDEDIPRCLWEIARLVQLFIIYPLPDTVNRRRHQPAQQEMRRHIDAHRRNDHQQTHPNELRHRRLR